MTHFVKNNGSVRIIISKSAIFSQLKLILKTRWHRTYNFFNASFQYFIVLLSIYFTPWFYELCNIYTFTNNFIQVPTLSTVFQVLATLLLTEEYFEQKLISFQLVVQCSKKRFQINFFFKIVKVTFVFLNNTFCF